MTVKEKITDLLMSTQRSGIMDLIKYLNENAFFDAPCSTSYHLPEEGGLAKHSLNVYDTAMELYRAFYGGEPDTEMHNSIIICSLLHDIGKIGQFGKMYYVPNMLKGRATKANPNPEPKQSEAKPWKSNPDLMYVDHEVRALPIIAKYIDLTEQEQQAILWHNGMYGPFKYQIQGRETPLYMIIHFADMWASRVLEKDEGGQEDD